MASLLPTPFASNLFKVSFNFMWSFHWDKVSTFLYLLLSFRTFYGLLIAQLVPYWPCAKSAKLSIYYSFFFFFFCGHTWSIWKFLAQELNLSCSCDLYHSCGNTRSSNPLHLAGNWTLTSAAIPAAAVGFLTHCATVGAPCITHSLKGFHGILHAGLSLMVAEEARYSGLMERALYWEA